MTNYSRPTLDLQTLRLFMESIKKNGCEQIFGEEIWVSIKTFIFVPVKVPFGRWSEGLPPTDAVLK